ncbi:Exosome complex component RRP43 [Savitreella phatthalungensis]
MQPLTFPPELYKRLVPREYLAKHLAHSGKRPSAYGPHRLPTEFRDITCTRSSLAQVSAGSAVVRCGATVVACGIRAEIASATMLDAINKTPKGFLVPNIDISPLCLPNSRSGPPDADTQIITARLDEILLPCIAREDLVITVDEDDLVDEVPVWCLWVDCVVLSADGGLLSTAVGACVAALADVVLPSVRYSIDDGRVVLADGPGKKLDLKYTPIVAEFAVFNNTVLCDPTGDEAALCAEVATVVVHVDGDRVRLGTTRKSGGTVIGIDGLQEIQRQAVDRARKVAHILTN